MPTCEFDFNKKIKSLKKARMYHYIINLFKIIKLLLKYLEITKHRFLFISDSDGQVIYKITSTLLARPKKG